MRYLIISIIMVITIVFSGCDKSGSPEIENSSYREIDAVTGIIPITGSNVLNSIPVAPDPMKEYEIQLLSSKDLQMIRLEKQKLDKNGYEAKVIGKPIEGDIYYRLRLKNRYSLNEAEEIGKEIRNKIDSISDFWIEKIV